jgi:hypothetical protein
MRLCGNSKPEFWIAARTRSRDSRTALSPSPTMENAGRPGRRSTSTVTSRDSMPSMAKVVTRASMAATLGAVVSRDCDAVCRKTHTSAAAT